VVVWRFKIKEDSGFRCGCGKRRREEGVYWELEVLGIYE